MWVWFSRKWVKLGRKNRPYPKTLDLPLNDSAIQFQASIASILSIKREPGRKVTIFLTSLLIFSEADPPSDPVLEYEMEKYQEDLATVDIHSESFSSLPPHVQHELLLERQQIEKYTYHAPQSLPQVSP